MGNEEDWEVKLLRKLREVYEGIFMSSGGYSKEFGMDVVVKGEVDLVVYGWFFILNFDLVNRFKINVFLNKYDRIIFYIYDFIVGYIDYFFLDEEIV